VSVKGIVYSAETTPRFYPFGHHQPIITTAIGIFVGDEELHYMGASSLHQRLPHVPAGDGPPAPTTQCAGMLLYPVKDHIYHSFAKARYGRDAILAASYLFRTQRWLLLNDGVGEA
jgi:hypothetical protein